MTEQRKLEIAERLRGLWEESDETYLSIAEALDVRERTVASWLSPTKPEPISYKSAKKFAELFNVSIDWLWRGEEITRVPADFMERIEALEAEVRELRKAKAGSAKATPAEVARRSLPKKKKDSAPAPARRKRQQRRGS